MMEEEQEEDISPRRRPFSNDKEEESEESIQTSESNNFPDKSSSSTAGEHDVEFTVTIAVAVPTEADDQLKDATAKQMIDAPRAQNYYHLELNLLPEDELFKTDVVTYGVACKIYNEKHEARVIRTWQDGNLTWHAWAHSHTVTMTSELLLKMLNHVVELRLWNSKDKCSVRARFDRPKAFRLPQPKPGEKPEDVGGVKTMVTKLLKRYVEMLPKKDKLARPLVSHVSSIALEGRENVFMNRQVLDTKVQIAAPTKAGTFGNQLTEAEQLEGRSSAKSKKVTSEKGKGEKSKGGGKEEKVANEAKFLSDNIRKLGLCKIPLRLNLLFAGCQTVVSRLESPVPGVEDMFLEVSIGSPLLSPSQEIDLNPMVIQICNAVSLPDTPISYTDLRLKCDPVYCKYTFFKDPDHVTPGKEQCKNIYWDDTTVVLLGTLEPSQLREYLTGPGMDIEVHDRDRKPEQVTLKPTLFGDDLEDEKISNVGTVESRRTLYNPFHGRDKPWDPYGVAKVDFSELLLGCKYLELKIPILNCSIPDILGISPNATGKLVGIAGAVDGPVDQPFKAGHYIQNSSMLKVKFRLAHPLIRPIELMAKEYLASTKECPFNRIIFMFDYHNVELLHNLQTLIMSFNARALGLDSMPQHVIDAALSTYKLSIMQQCSLDLDIVTGFHVLDGVRHIFVLEGLRDKAISILWETLPQTQQSDVCILYNSDLSFSKRLYGPLDVDLCRIKLHEPLSVIVQQPLLYVRDMVFRPCYDALIKLDQITKTGKMRNVVRNNLFPSAEMVVSMSREFGVPFTQQDFEELKSIISEESMDQDVITDKPGTLETSQKFNPIDTFNYVYEEHLRKSRQFKNYIDNNIKDVHLQSKSVHAEREKNNKAYLSVELDPAYNYSIQYLNSMELAKDYLREYLRKQDPTAMYAYNQEYLSGMFCPVNTEQERKELEAAKRARWRTKNGWTNPGKKSIRESYIHPHSPDSARLDELQEKWTENILHASSMKSPLDRDHFPWCDRKKDFDLYTRPASSFGSKVHSSIYSPGTQLTQEMKAVKQQLMEDWKSRIVTDDIRQYFHRVLPATEMKMAGCYSSNQLDRLKGILKDPARKRGLVVRDSNVNDIPPLAVINNPCLDESSNQTDLSSYDAHWCDAHAKFCGLNPGDLPYSWTRDDNQIPCYNYNHEKFKQLKGHDFNALHKNREKLSIRPILALQPEERDNNLFRAPFSASPYRRPLPPVVPRSQNAKILLNENHNHMSNEKENLPVEATEHLTSAGLPESQVGSETTFGLSSQANPQTLVEPLQQHIPVMT